MMRRLTILPAAALLLSACAEDKTPPRSVSEFVENPILLEAAIVRCSRDRAESRYDAECINAREAANLVEAQEDENRRTEIEARSEAKRRALRRRQEAQEEARRLADAERRRLEEAEYLAQFGALPPAGAESDEDEMAAGNEPMAIVPEGENVDDQPLYGESLPAGDASNAPVAEVTPKDGEDP